MTSSIKKRIAIIEPLGDRGIGTYTYELAESLVGIGMSVDVYTATQATSRFWPRKHGFFPVLGSALVRQRSEIAAAISGTQRAVEERDTPAGSSPAVRRMRRIPKFLKWRPLRETYMTLELVHWLRVSKYDLVWTQWPEMGNPLVNFWRAASMRGLRVVHTAHNVFPHERRPGDQAMLRKVYDNAHLIVTHSDMATRALHDAFPGVDGRVATSRHGLYTTYTRNPQARQAVRAELNIASDETAVLAFGGVRPYKNTETLLAAIAADATKRFVLVVAGVEAGYPNLDPRDALAITRRNVAALGIGDRVRLLPGHGDNDRASALFEASDVIALPYVESYGSGVLCLAMSFGKPIVASRAGGMDEYLAAYRDGVVVEPNVSGPDLLAALGAARDKRAASSSEAPRPAELEWQSIVRTLEPDLERVARQQ